MEPTVPVHAYYPEFHGPPAYLQPPPPPSPPPSPHRNKVLAALLLVGMLIMGSSFGIYLLITHAALQSSVPVFITPTPNLKVNLRTSDFSQFFDAFAGLAQQHDYASIRTVTDTQNFQAIALGTDPPYQDWRDFSPPLLSGDVTFSFSSPPITADEAGYTCFGYGPNGIGSAHVSIEAQSLQFIVGTMRVTGGPNDQQPPAFDDVFVFELPNTPTATWLWRAVTFNNSLGCG